MKIDLDTIKTELGYTVSDLADIIFSRNHNFEEVEWQDTAIEKIFTYITFKGVYTDIGLDTYREYTNGDYEFGLEYKTLSQREIRLDLVEFDDEDHMHNVLDAVERFINLIDNTKNKTPELNFILKLLKMKLEYYENEKEEFYLWQNYDPAKEHCTYY